jgi:hypothetical protein
MSSDSEWDAAEDVQFIHGNEMGLKEVLEGLEKWSTGSLENFVGAIQDIIEERNETPSTDENGEDDCTCRFCTYDGRMSDEMHHCACCGRWTEGEWDLIGKFEWQDSVDGERNLAQPFCNDCLYNCIRNAFPGGVYPGLYIPEGHSCVWMHCESENCEDGWCVGEEGKCPNGSDS